MENNYNVAYFKIHPAIGVAHLGTYEEIDKNGNSIDDVEFFERIAAFQKAVYTEDKSKNKEVYKSFKSKQGFKKQSVQFSVHAYDKDGNWLYEVSNEDVEWNIKLANRKLHNYSKKSDHKFYLPEIKGKWFIDQVADKDKIIGKNPWTGEEKIDLGKFSDGKFIPPVAMLYNKNGVVNDLPNASIDQYPADASFDPVTKDNLRLNYTDNTSDGVIAAKVKIKGTNGNEYTTEAEPAWLVVAPPKTNVFFTPAEAEKIKNTGRNFFPLENTNYNLDFIKKTSKLLDVKSVLGYIECNCESCKESEIKEKINNNKNNKINKHHLLKSNFFCEKNPYHKDYFMMSTINGDYDPGMEICLSGDPERNEADFDIETAFMKPGINHIKTDEIRVKPFDEQAKIGTKPGQLTSGLCSTWQGDLIACLNFWTAENPLMAYGVPNNDIKKLQAEKGKIVMHKDENENNRFEYAEEIVKSMSKRSLVYHEYDEEGNVYFIKVPDTAN